MRSPYAIESVFIFAGSHATDVVGGGVMSQMTATFADLLRQLRTAAALSQEELAERAGLSLRGLSDLERGVRRTPHLSTVRLLADALALGPEDRQALLAAARPGAVSETTGAPPAPVVSLPLPLTSLLGREQDLAELISLLGQCNLRLVTLTGAGGSGKTRLALEAAARLQGTFPDGVVFVDLTPLRDPQFVLATIAAALGVRERPGHPLGRRSPVFWHRSGSSCCWTTSNRSSMLLPRSPPCWRLVRGWPCWPPAGRRCACEVSASSRCRPCRCRPASAWSR